MLVEDALRRIDSGSSVECLPLVTCSDDSTGAGWSSYSWVEGMGVVERSGVVEVDDMEVRLLLLPDSLELVSKLSETLIRSQLTAEFN